MTCWLTFLDYASSGLAWLLQWEGNYEDNEVIFCHTIVALMKVCATVKFSTLIPNSWQHLGATHFHLIPHSHGNTSGQPTSISSHILMATLWGNPFPSPKEKQMKWMLLYYGKGWYSQFHLGNILSLVRQDADPWVWVVTNCTRTLFPSITSVPHH
jgi:hypothetical protein